MRVNVFVQVVVWRLLQDQLPLSVDLQWALSCLCLALQQPCVWNKLSTLEYKTYTCSLIYCLHLIIAAGEEHFCKAFLYNSVVFFYTLSLYIYIYIFAFQWLFILVTGCCIQRRKSLEEKKTVKISWTRLFSTVRSDSEIM